MRNYIAFLKKELLESVRTYKFFVIIAVFFAFGMMSPLAAKLMPKLISYAQKDGMKISMPEPAAIDSWKQFFKNISGMGIIVTALIFSGVLANELSRGTLINMLTKGLNRSTVIISKFTAMIIIWTTSYALAFTMAFIYTAYLFKNHQMHNLLFSIFCLWLFGVFLLAVILLGGVLAKSSYGCLFITGTAAVILMILNAFPKMQKYNPFSLSSNNVALLTNSVKISELYYPIFISGVLILVCVIGSISIFNKQQI
ncbi:ABC transporter permease [Clostridium guangxiense]|uniref:ABC transporter permease n=1 Tax=Clostridium guangxiense TaxID=1662055 RepID=UPI001E507C6C|nr:ABC transporter permease subunit [Clostridium guangxiense]MCD2345685.1 ABC transporter permease [Clostridium guangxiense]